MLHESQRFGCRSDRFDAGRPAPAAGSQIDVVLVARGEHGRAIRDRGAVRLDGPWGRYSVPVKASREMSDIAGSDFVLVTVKSQDLEPALSAAKPYLAGAVVISIQNGINDEALARYVAAERLVMGMTATNMAILEPGAVSLQLDGATVVGPSPDGANADGGASGGGPAAADGLAGRRAPERAGRALQQAGDQCPGLRLVPVGFQLHHAGRLPPALAASGRIADRAASAWRRSARRASPSKIPGRPESTDWRDSCGC